MTQAQLEAGLHFAGGEADWGLTARFPTGALSLSLEVHAAKKPGAWVLRSIRREHDPGRMCWGG